MAAPPRKQVHLIGPGCQERFLALDAPAAQPLRDAGVVLAGVSDLVKPYEICRPEPTWHVVLLCLAGAGRLEVPGCPPRLAAGELAILPAGVTHAYGVDSGTWRILWFHFALSAGLGQALRGRTAVVHAAAHLPRLQAAMEGYIAESRGDDDRSHRAAELHAELIGCYLERELAIDSDPRAAAQRRRLQQLWDDVERDLRQPWSVSSLANRLHESQVNLYRFCMRHYGTKPMAMVTRLRMERARQLLRETDEPLKRIADWVGYRNEFAFSTAFKRFGGASPRDFRRKAREPAS